MSHFVEKGSVTANQRSPSSTESSPALQVLVRTRDAVTLFDGPKLEGESWFEESKVSVIKSSAGVFADLFPNLRINPVYSPDGRTMCTVFESKPNVGSNVSLYDAENGMLQLELPIGDAEQASFSPHGTFLVTWSRPKGKGSATEGARDGGNLRIWLVAAENAAAGRLVSSYSQKVFKSDTVQWTADEQHCFRLVTNEVHIFNGLDMLNSATLDGKLAAVDDAGEEAERDGESAGSRLLVVGKVQHRGLTQFRVSPAAPTDYGCACFVSVFTPEAGGKPARVSVYRYTPVRSDGGVGGVEGPVCSRTIFAASEARMMWNSLGSALLVHSHSDADANSYYGTSTLFLVRPPAGLTTLGTGGDELSCKVEQTKAGPVHDAQWSPSGDRFAVAAGAMPCQCTLFDAQGTAVFHFGAAHRNTISFSPHGRFLCIAGFGNLAGEIDFYDTLRLKKIGSNVSHCATSHGWSPCSRFFLTASLAPRMNVDNCFKLFKYNGLGPLATLPFDRAFFAAFRPASSMRYPNRGPSPKRNPAQTQTQTQQSASASSSSANKPQPYRAPGSTGSLSSFMREHGAQSSAPSGKAKKGGATASGTGKFVPGVQSRQQRLIPGMAPPTAKAKAGSKSGGNSSSRCDGGGSKQQLLPQSGKSSSKTQVAHTAPAAPSAPAASGGGGGGGGGAVDREKRAKAIGKKLKQIEEMKTKRAAGHLLQPEQEAKIATEATLRDELRQLSL